MTRDRLPPLAMPDDDVSIVRTSLASSVADHLRAMIVSGTLGPGERVQVMSLAASLAVSATPVREALIILAEDRLVELLPNRGARVLPYTAGEALALFEVIAALEALAARLATVRMGGGDLDRLEGRHAAMASHHRRGEKEPYFALNTEIHAVVLALAGNADLVATHARLDLRARRGRYMAILDQARWDEAMDEHEALMSALRRRDPDAAAAIWLTHLHNTGVAVGRAWSRRATGGDIEPRALASQAGFRRRSDQLKRNRKAYKVLMQVKRASTLSSGLYRRDCFDPGLTRRQR